MVTRNPFWMMSSALGEIISIAVGLDLWCSPLALVFGYSGDDLLTQERLQILVGTPTQPPKML